MCKKVLRFVLICMTMTVMLAVSALAVDLLGGIVETASSVNFRSQPSTSSAVIDRLSNGTKVAVLDQQDDWYFVAYAGTTGYISSDYVSTQAVMNVEAGGAKVNTAVLNLRSKPSTDSEVVTRLTQGAVAKIIGINNGWLKVTYGSYTGYICPDYVSIVSYSASSSSDSGNTAVASAYYSNSSDTSDLRQQVVNYAKSFLGVRYVYGGSTPKGFDCSGFTKYVFDHFDISLQRTSAKQYSTSVTKIKKADLRPGDLVFFSTKSGSSTVGHVGIYIGNNNFIHASSPGDVVKIDSMSSSYYSARYVGSGRVISD